LTDGAGDFFESPAAKKKMGSAAVGRSESEIID